MTELDPALDVFHRTGPEYAGGLSNHGPMVVEVLEEWGVSARIPGWVERYREKKDLEPAPAPGVPLTDAEGSAALGEVSAFPRWLARFEAELEGTPWSEVLRGWCPRLAPGLAGAALHGLLRTAHATRALSRSVTPSRRRELAHGLAYWAATYARLPLPPMEAGRGDEGDGAKRPSELLPGLELLPAERRARRGLIVDRLLALEGFTPFAKSVARIDLTLDPSTFLSDLAAVAARAYLDNRSHDPIAFVHGVTGPSAVRLLLPHTDEEGARSLLLHAWLAAAGIYSVFAKRPLSAEVPVPGETPEDLEERCLENRNAHAIKLGEACLREWALAPDPVLLAAAADGAARLSA